MLLRNRYYITSQLLMVYGKVWVKRRYDDIISGFIQKLYHETIYESDFKEVNFKELPIRSKIPFPLKKEKEFVAINKLLIDNNVSEKSITLIIPKKELLVNSQVNSLVKSSQVSSQVSSCHAYNCKLYKSLTTKYNGDWCDSHLREISDLRTIIRKHDGSYDEAVCRLKELTMRKNFDVNHWFYALKLFKKYTF
jgi:hypothetical protein